MIINNEDKEESPLIIRKERNTEVIKEQMKAFIKFTAKEIMIYILIILAVLCILDFYFNNKQNLSNFIEIFKVLLFTISGYLFGKNE